MKITDIKQQVKRQHRYSVFIDGKYSFSLGESQLLSLGVRKNKEINQTEIHQLQGESEFGKTYEKILNLLSYRPRSEWELRDYLKRKDTTPALVDEILNKLSESGYINDEQFAQRWVENRRLLKPISARKLNQELTQKRIDRAIIEKVLTEDETNEQDELRKLVEKKRSRYPDNQKLMAYLARQGFSYEDIKNVLTEIDS